MMKSVLALSLMVALSNIFAATAQAGEPKATVCSKEAVEAATALFNLNNKTVTKTTSKTDLVDMFHGENGYEVWDVKFNANGIDYSPYRITVTIDGCIVTAFEMPFAG